MTADQTVLTYSIRGIPKKFWTFPEGENPNLSYTRIARLSGGVVSRLILLHFRSRK